MNKIISIIVILLVVVGGFFLFKDKTVAPVENVSVNTSMPVPDSNVSETTVIKEFTVHANNFAFSPKTIEVNVGDTVKVTVKNLQGMHDLRIDEFNAKTRVLNKGEEETITFVADKAGTFEYYCSIGTHRQMGMVG